MLRAKVHVGEALLHSCSCCTVWPGLVLSIINGGQTISDSFLGGTM